jgi:hypothetical protein
MDAYDRLLTRQQEQDDCRQLVRQAREQIQVELGERELPSPEEVIYRMREERDARLLAVR